MKVKEIARLIGGSLDGDGEAAIVGVAAVGSAGSSDLAFIESGAAVETSAGCLIAPSDFAGHPGCPIIRVAEPKLCFARAAAAILPRRGRRAGIHPTAAIAASADIGDDVSIGPFCSVGERTRIGQGSELHAGAKIADDVVIGADCVIHPNVVIEDRCRLGNNVVLHAGAVIGADGFGFVRAEDGHTKFPQAGIVIIEDDVEIGANTCIDRGSLGDTRIGRGSKLDNLVQIAHNVEIGQRVVIAAQTGISGSTVIEDDCVIGGQVGMGDHARVKSGAVIGSQAGVLPGKIVRPGVWWGTPVQPLDEYKRQNAMVKGLKRLRDEVRELKRSRR